MRPWVIALLLLTVIVVVLTDSIAAETADASRPLKPIPQKQVGFFDNALDHINPGQFDYGAEARNLRSLMVTTTIENIYFFCTISALLLLVGVASVHLFHLRAEDKKELLAATLITELWNGRVSDRIEIDRRTEQYNTLVAQQNAKMEEALDRERETTAQEDNANSRTHKKIDRLIGGARSGSRRTGLAKEWSSEVPLGAPAPSDLRQQNLLLERRIEAMRNTEQNLRERLNQTTSQLEDERKRNKTLKGA